MGTHPVIGVDVGGSGVKAALVDVERGELVSDRPRLETPQPATPDRVAHTVAQLVDGLGGSSVIGAVQWPASTHRARSVARTSWVSRQNSLSAPVTSFMS